VDKKVYAVSNQFPILLFNPAALGIYPSLKGCWVSMVVNALKRGCSNVLLGPAYTTMAELGLLSA